MRVVGGIVSPSHPTLVRQRHRVRAAEIIPPKHRLSMARAAVGKRRCGISVKFGVSVRTVYEHGLLSAKLRGWCHSYVRTLSRVTDLYRSAPGKNVLCWASTKVDRTTRQVVAKKTYTRKYGKLN